MTAHALLRAFRPLTWLVAAASLALAGYFLDLGRSDWYLLGALVGAAAVIDAVAVELRGGMRVSAGHLAAPYAIMAIGGPAGVLAAAGFLVGRLAVRPKAFMPFDVAVNLAAAGITAGLWEAAGPILPAASSSGRVFADILVVAGFVWIRARIVRLWLAESRSRGMKVPDVSNKTQNMLLTCAVAFTPVLALVLVHDRNSWATWALLIFPFAAPQLLVRSFGREVDALDRERTLNLELERSSIVLTESLVATLDARDEYTAGHSLAVAVYSRDIARETGMHEDDVERIYMAGLLHDIGKIAVPDAILRKPGRLTDEEFDEIKKHPTVGARILAKSERFSHLLNGVLYHHERLDGRGYPEQLKGDEIPLDARIIAVADAYNAMTSKRSYRDAMPSVTAMHILHEHAGSQHEAHLVDAFERVLNTRDAEYAQARGPEFHISRAVEELLAEDPPEPVTQWRRSA